MMIRDGCDDGGCRRFRGAPEAYASQLIIPIADPTRSTAHRDEVVVCPGFSAVSECEVALFIGMDSK